MHHSENMPLHPDTPLPDDHIADPRLVSRQIWQDEIAARHGIDGTHSGNFQKPFGINDLEEPEVAHRALMHMLRTIPDSDRFDVIGHVRRIEATALVGNSRIASPFDPPDKRPDFHEAVMSDPKVQEVIGRRDFSKAEAQLFEGWQQLPSVYESGIRRGIESGYILPEVADRLHDAFHKTSVRVADTSITEVLGPGGAYYRNDADEIGVDHKLGDSGDSHEKFLGHEVGHKLSGGTFVAKPGTNEYYRTRVGYSSEIREEIVTRKALTEAVNEHLTIGILTGDFENFDPDDREDGDQSYYDYRKIVGTFIKNSGGLVHAKTLTRGSFEDTGPDGSLEERRKLVNETVSAYGYGALRKLEALCELADRVGTDRLNTDVLSRIHPPQIDKTGHVIAKGYLDTEDMPGITDD